MAKLKSDKKLALITGGAKRIGGAIAARLHSDGYDICLHYNRSHLVADRLIADLNKKRPKSAYSIAADLADRRQLKSFINKVLGKHNSISVLVNNASEFYAHPFEQVDSATWQKLLDIHLTAPFFLTQSFLSLLKNGNGSIINMLDIYASRPLNGYSVYCVTKAGLAMMTRSLALELGDEIRVNAIAPGMILWPESANQEYIDRQKQVVDRLPLKRIGNLEDIVQGVIFLLNSTYVTGQIITIDGGKSLL